MGSAYALILCSRIEGFNTTAMEAAHFGVPSIASDTVGLRDFVRHGRNGLLFREGDADSLAHALATLAERPAERDALGRQARQDALAYRPDRVADGFLDAIAEVCSEWRSLRSASPLPPWAAALANSSPPPSPPSPPSQPYPPIAPRESASRDADPLGAAA
jgi:hypothetical protein